ncbi:MAG: hypothetical protein ACI9HB_002261, partial [Gammaproteobacteria bacterium]
QKSHVYHSNIPQQILSGVRLHMGHFSVTILTSTGSVLSDIQQYLRLSHPGDERSQARLGVGKLFVLTF